MGVLMVVLTGAAALGLLPSSAGQGPNQFQIEADLAYSMSDPVTNGPGHFDFSGGIEGASSCTGTGDYESDGTTLRHEKLVVNCGSTENRIGGVLLGTTAVSWRLQRGALSYLCDGVHSFGGPAAAHVVMTCEDEGCVGSLSDLACPDIAIPVAGSCEYYNEFHTALLYEHINFGGALYTQGHCWDPHGRDDQCETRLKNMVKDGINDWISSFDPLNNCELQVHEHVKWQGSTIGYTTSWYSDLTTVSLGSGTWNDQISSDKTQLA